jgi:hypothetical protein
MEDSDARDGTPGSSPRDSQSGSTNLESSLDISVSIDITSLKWVIGKLQKVNGRLACQTHKRSKIYTKLQGTLTSST